MDPKGLLHEDMFLDVLRRLPPRGLAVSRCVCKAWRAVIDGHRAELLQLSLEGIFLELYDPYVTPQNRYQDHETPVLFCRRSTGREIPVDVGYPDNTSHDGIFESMILDCCNGLLLLRNDHVVNPATRQWAELPLLPSPCRATYCCYCDSMYSKYLVFDPTVSPHYEVFSVPHIREHECTKSVTATEWPPTPYIAHVFSSRTGEWGERSFIRHGKAVTEYTEHGFCRGATYWHGALYVNFDYDFILRLKYSNNTYKVIELPKDNKEFYAPRLGKSENGVYCAYRYADAAFQIWFLDESCGQMEWVLKNDINFAPIPWRKIISGSWILQEHDNMEELVLEDNSEWDPDHENVVNTEHWVEARGNGICDFLGFHPFKEIALLMTNGRVMAYHLNTSMVRDLGYIYTGDNGIECSFPYTPCWMGPLPGASKHLI